MRPSVRPSVGLRACVTVLPPARSARGTEVVALRTRGELGFRAAARV